MNIKNTVYTLLVILPFLTGCGEDRTNELYEKQSTQRWIYKTMLENYYWYQDIPEKKEKDFWEEPSKFFTSLLSIKDGNQDIGGSFPFSYIEDTKLFNTPTRSIPTPHNSYGMEFAKIGNRESEYIVLYTLPNSPAAQIGLQRNDIITRINGKKIDDNKVYQNNIEGSLLSGPEIIINYRRDNENRQNTLGASTSIEDNPLLICKKLEGYSNLGYVVYNHFTYGTPEEENSSTPYYEGRYLQNMVNRFRSELQGVSTLILDFRYNPGGELNTACVLAAMICPQADLDIKLGSLKFNEKRRSENSDLKTSRDFLNKAHAENLNIDNLYIITSRYTASASEFIINALKPFMNVHIIGEKTIGKNVGSQGYTHNGWHIQPIVLQIYNSLDQSNYNRGFVPGLHNATNSTEISHYEITDTPPLKQLGTPEEPLLNKVLNIIYGGENMQTGITRSTNNNTYKIDIKDSSIEKKRSSLLLIE